MSEKCFVCNKKINILDSIVCKCRCNKTFCQRHKFANNQNSDFGHICEFDYTTIKPQL